MDYALQPVRFTARTALAATMLGVLASIPVPSTRLIAVQLAVTVTTIIALDESAEGLMDRAAWRLAAR